jgi:hypothetical protein
MCKNSANGLYLFSIKYNLLIMSDLIVNGFVSVFLCGLFGGFAVECVRWYGLRNSENFGRYKKPSRYWIVTIGMMITGGILAVFYGVDNVSAIMAANIGASAPALITAAEKSQPSPSSRQSSPSSSTGGLEITISDRTLVVTNSGDQAIVLDGKIGSESANRKIGFGRFAHVAIIAIVVILFWGVYKITASLFWGEVVLFFGVLFTLYLIHRYIARFSPGVIDFLAGR